jgi:hypothetical protein
VTSEAYRGVQAERVARLIALHREMAACGLQPTDPGLEQYMATAARAADRMLANYALRACGGLMELAGNAVDGMILLALCAANLRALQVEHVSSWSRYADLARPCSAEALARELGMAGETVRRHLHRLAGKGLCRRTSGWIAAAPLGSEPLLGRLANENAQNLRRLFAALNELRAHRPPDAGRQAL